MMKYKRIIPVLLIKDYGLVKTKKFASPRYVGDPINAVKIFNECEADELIILDISDRTLKKGPDFSYIGKVANQCFMPVCYGGGVHSIDDMKKLFYLGIEKISVNTQAFYQPDMIREAVKLFGSQSIVGSMDVKMNGSSLSVYVGHGKKRTKTNPIDYMLYLEQIGVGEILVNSIDRDGMRTGYDTGLVSDMIAKSKVPIIACGGANKISDCENIINKGASAAAAGSMFVFWGRNEAVLINYPNRSDYVGK